MADAINPPYFSPKLPTKDGGKTASCCAPPECPRILPRTFRASSIPGAVDQIDDLILTIRAGTIFWVSCPANCMLLFYDELGTNILSLYAHEAGTHAYVCPWGDIGAVQPNLSPTGVNDGITAAVWTDGAW